ncbi:AAA family ATPase [Maridesulfovibrio sp.]|uniref:AAA family ATPase n=1 Tax=Maridesulfovibrio sp. TaxID=2795000 RepID=UPI003B00BD4D
MPYKIMSLSELKACARKMGLEYNEDDVSRDIFTVASLPDQQFKTYQLARLFEAGELVVVFAPQKTGKSLLVVDMLLTLVGGGNFGDRLEAHEKVFCLLVDAEMPGHKIRERLNNFSTVHPDGVDSLSIIPLRDSGRCLNLLDAKDQDWLYSRIKECGAKVVALDNLGKLVPANRESKPETWRILEKWLRGLNKEGITTILVHHANKTGDIRGTGKISDDADLVISLSRPDGWDRSKGTAIDFEIVDSRNLYGDDLIPFTVVYSGEGGGFSQGGIVRCSRSRSRRHGDHGRGS